MPLGKYVLRAGVSPHLHMTNSKLLALGQDFELPPDASKEVQPSEDRLVQ